MSRNKQHPGEGKDRIRRPAPFPPIDYDDAQELVAALNDSARKVYVVSDTHFFHERLWTVLHPTAEGGRDHRNTELLIANWRKLVRYGDVVLHLGDVALGIPVAEYRSRIGWLPGEIWLLPGNHDRTAEKLEQFRDMGWKLVLPFSWEHAGKEVCFTHEPIAPEQILPQQLNVHGHIHHHPAYSEQYVNCCVEWLGYAPVDLRQVIRQHIEGVGRESASDPGGFAVGLT